MGNVVSGQPKSNLVIASVPTLVVLLSSYYLLRSKKEPLGSDGKPVPKAEGYSALWGHTMTAAKNRHRLYDYMLENAQRLNGKPFLVDIIGRPPLLIITSPEHMDDVFNKQDGIFERGPLTRSNHRDFWGNGIFNVDGDEWYVQRKTASHLFSLQMMKDVMHEVIREKSAVLLDALNTYADRKEVCSIRALLAHYSADVFIKIAFGVDLKCIENGLEGNDSNDFIDAFSQLSTLIRGHMSQPQWLWKTKRYFGLGAEGELAKHKKIVDDFCYNVIDRSVRQRNEALLGGGDRVPPPKDLISMFLDKETKGLQKGQALQADHEAIRDLVINFIFAGKDTTAVSMSWFIIEMNKNPHIVYKIRAELHEKVPHIFNKGEILEMEELSKLTYLEACIRENLRLHAAAPNDSRSASIDTTLSDGTFIPANVVLGIGLYAAGHLKCVWGDDVEEFKPERWLTTSGELTVVSPAKFPVFAAGNHRCLGERFAYMEMKITLATILGNFDVKMVDEPKDAMYEMAMTLLLSGDLNCTVSKT